MKMFTAGRWTAFSLFLLIAGNARAELPENLAAKASVWASSSYDKRYEPKFALDGTVPMAGTGQDPGKAWCVRKSESGDSGEFRLEWPTPVQLGEILYFGRTAWYMTECWKDYEVYMDGGTEPVASGTLNMVHGPQRIELPARRMTLVRVAGGE